MCGIAGVYALNQNPVSRPEIEAQIATMVHRGPDQGGVFVDPQQRCGLGIRRLSIIDVAGGSQPLCNQGNTIHLVYNGETYNHQTLRSQLEVIGHRPRSHSDGEAVLHGYQAWGPEGILQHMRGMFAFALWDDDQQQLFLARDRFGIKPLYYAQYAGRLWFASEIKAILTQPDFPRRVNLNALQAMLTLGFVPGPATMFEGIFKLPPAHYLIAKDGSFQLKKYWQLEYTENARLSEAQAAEQFLVLLQESVQLRLMSEVPLGALLSGGLDSGALVALVQAGMSRQLKTVSIGFADVAYDESARAVGLAQFIGTEHHPISFTAADFDDYPAVMCQLEEPQCSATALPIYRLYQACRQAGLTVVLTGEGADELLGGYHWHQGDALARRLVPLPASLRRLLAVSPLPISAAARRVLVQGQRDVAARYQNWLAVADDTLRRDLLADEVNSLLVEANQNPLLAGWANKLGDPPPGDPLNQMLLLQSQTRLPDFINMEVDKMSMAHSIEARVPFLDHKLWEFCASLPPQFKLKGRIEKHLLRQATRHLLPEETRQRRKKGLASPYARWLQAERLPVWAEEALSEASLRRSGLFNPATVLNLRRAHQAGQPGLGPLLMGVLSTQVWYDGFMG